jgi:hypothetical protein
MKSNTSYRFSPITNLEQLLSAINYIAEQTSLLAKQATGLDLAIKSLTVFSHYNDEFEVLKNIIKPLGKPHNENNGPRIKLDQPIKSKTNNIEYLRIRHPDSGRPQVGCNDFIVENYQNFKEQFLNENHNLRLIVRPNYEMIEFFDTKFDVLAYIVSK